MSNMKILNDKTIRQALIAKFEQSGLEAFEIMQELHVCSSEAIADVVTLREEAHCYEIKGETDKVARILEQGVHYNKAFRRITLVTTENHLAKAISIAPPYWGIILARISSNGEVVLKQVRKDKVNPEFHAVSALFTLWKDEIISLLDNPLPRHKRSNYGDLAKMAAENKRSLEVSRNVAHTLCNRHRLLIANDYKFLTYR